MKRLALSLALLLAAAGPALAAGDNPPPALLAKIQLATQAHQGAGSALTEKKTVRPAQHAFEAAPAPQAAKREFKDLQKFVRENPQAASPQTHQAGGSIAATKDRPAQSGGNVSSKKVGSLNTDKMMR